jgi:acetyl esterase/lipase
LWQIKVVGHSLGGGTAALLTYVLREQQEFASATCVAFAPGVHVMMFFSLNVRDMCILFHFIGHLLCQALLAYVI